MPQFTTAEKMWDEYASNVLPPDASFVQVIETRKAFYAGAYSMAMAMVASLGPEEEATDADVHAFDMLISEVEGWIRGQTGRSH